MLETRTVLAWKAAETKDELSMFAVWVDRVPAEVICAVEGNADEAEFL